MIKNTRIAISHWLRIGVSISFLLMMTGGLLYLRQHGNEIVNYQFFHGEPKELTSFSSILVNALSLAPIGIIQLGLVLLFFVQILRVILTAWYFLQARDILFAGISFFIFLVLMLSFIRL